MELDQKEMLPRRLVKCIHRRYYSPMKLDQKEMLARRLVKYIH